MDRSENITRFTTNPEGGIAEAHRVLTEPAKQLEPEEIAGWYVKKVVNDLRETLEAQGRGGVGLAAPQIGEEVAIAYVRICPPEDYQGPIKLASLDMILINPEYEGIGEPTRMSMSEGCLSNKTDDPETTIMGYTTRFPKIKLTWYDEHGELHEDVFEGAAAQVIQHEVDHLNGNLFPERVSTPEDFLSFSALLRQMGR